MEPGVRLGCLSSRPGGFTLTDRAVSLGRFHGSTKILDLGCGSGESVEYLRANNGFETFGLDSNPEFHKQNPEVITGSAENIPFPDGSMDGILMECSFSMVEDQEKVLRECHRVLRAEGRLIITDMYSCGEPVSLSGCLGRIATKENIISIVQKNHFHIEQFEDCSHYLKTLWGQLILDQGAQVFYDHLDTSHDEMKRARCGYCIISASKSK